MKIIHLLSTLNPGGIGNFVSDLCNPAITSPNIEFVIAYTQGSGDLEQKFQKQGLEIIPCLKRAFFNTKLPYRVNKIIRNIENRFFFLKVYKLLKKEKPDIVHSHEHGSSINHVLFACCLVRVKFIIHIHSPSSNYFKEGLNCQIFKLLLRDSDRILAVSQGAMNHYNELLNHCSKNIIIIPNGIKDLMPRRIETKNKIERDLGIPQNSFILGFIGRLIPEKNVETLIQSFADLLLKGHDFYLIVVGEDAHRLVLENLVMELTIKGRVFFIGKVSNPEYWINSFDINILPSRYEGFPITVLEAFSKNIIMVASNVVGTNSIIKNKVNGFLFGLGNCNELSEIIKEIYSNRELKERIEDRARFDFLENYEIKKIIKHFEQCYRGMFIARDGNNGA